MNRQVIPGTARLCPTEPESSVEDAVSPDTQSALLEHYGAAGSERLSEASTAPGTSPRGHPTRSRQADQRYIGRRELRRLYPVSDMTTWRWTHDPDVAFPAAVKLRQNGRNFWWLPAILEWERRRANSVSPAGSAAP
jgi:hypothetical protein